MIDKNTTNYTLENIDSRDSIPFRRSNRYIAGSINGALLLEQIIYWYAKMGHKPFYKIKEPCESPQYKTGQSWCEELGFSSREFDTAIKLIGQKISKNKIRNEDVLVHYWVDFRRLTFYEINMDLYVRLKNEYYEKELIRLNSTDNEQSRICGKRIYGDRNCGKRSYVNAESAVSVNAESASGSIRDHLSEITRDLSLGDSANTPTVIKDSSIKTKRPYEQDDLFKLFYSNYPKKQKPHEAYKEFIKLKFSEDKVRGIIADVKMRLELDDHWQETRFIPYPATYLKARQWESEVNNSKADNDRKKEEKKIKANAQLAEMERRSQQEHDKHLQHTKDAMAGRKIIKKITEGAANGLKGLKDAANGILPAK